MTVCPICKSIHSSERCPTCETRDKKQDDTCSTIAFEPNFPAIPRITLLPPPLGSGAFGEVYRGTHEVLGIAVAVKFLTVNRTLDVRQALQEARVLARLDHPNLLRVFEAGEVDGVPYIVMELMDGGTCEEIKSLGWETAYDFATQLISGLHGLHQAKVLHRDIKPANCLLRRDDSRVKLSDLGLAVDWTASRSDYNLAGTPSYMAPELFQSVPEFSFASDIYALGLTLASLILERSPVPRGGIEDIRKWAHCGERPNFQKERGDLPVSFSNLLQRMCASDSRQRPSTNEALATLVEISRPSKRTAIVSNSDESAASVGRWKLGTCHYSSSNWTNYVVSHIETGSQARMMLLNRDAPIAAADGNILQSAERASNLSHENVIRVLDWGRYDSRPYIVTEPQGKTLNELMAVTHTLTERDVVAFMLSAAKGLEYLHRNGFVFQLIDPGAIAVRDDGVSSCLVWPAFCEVAGKRASKRAAVLVYAPPELKDQKATALVTTYEPSIDMYGLGATFFCATVGHSNYNPVAKNDLASSATLLNESLTAPVAKLITELVSQDPLDRPTANEVVHRLSRIAMGIGMI